MKILMPVLHYYPVIGGLEAWTQNIAEGIALRHGASTELSRKSSGQAEIFVVTSRVGDHPKNDVKNGVKIYRTSLFNLKDLSYSAPIFIFGALPFIFLKSFLFARAHKVNLLHCQGFLSACIGYCIFKITGIPYIVTVQRMEGSSFVKKIAYKRARVCIAASSAVKKYFEEIGCKNIEVIPNGVDLKRLEDLRQRSHGRFIVMTVARLEKVKGIEYLIEAIKNLQFTISPDFIEDARLSRHNFQLLIIGDGSERKNLENLVKKLGLEDRVKFVGQIPPEGIPEYLAMADCFVLPSLKEGFGIAVLEAMAAGVPVIASRVGGILDIIENEKTGLLVEPGNSRQIAAAIQKIYHDPLFREKLVNNAMAILKHYDWQDIAERVFKIYENCISHRDISA